jgi:hypothetical protein
MKVEKYYIYEIKRSDYYISYTKRCDYLYFINYYDSLSNISYNFFKYLENTYKNNGFIKIYMPHKESCILISTVELKKDYLILNSNLKNFRPILGNVLITLLYKGSPKELRKIYYNYTYSNLDYFYNYHPSYYIFGDQGKKIFSKKFKIWCKICTSIFKKV